jgi:DNA adenine methylase Dam
VQNLVKSPLNYTGGKYRLLPQLLSRMPARIDCLHDLFTGGGTIAANVPARRVHARDVIPDLVRLLAWLAKTPAPDVEIAIDALVRRHGLSESRLHGYAHYGTDSDSGLADANRAAYGSLKTAYNTLRRDPSAAEADLAAHFFALVIHGFNHQIRFSRRGDWNIPPGKRDFNPRIRANLSAFCAALQARSTIFSLGSYEALALSEVGAQDYLYADPPYLLTLASYNDSGGWGEDQERRLLAFLDKAHERGLRFGLSNVLLHKGRRHEILETWARARGHRVHLLSASYANASYHRKAKDEAEQEVFICNHGPVPDA